MENLILQKDGKTILKINIYVPTGSSSFFPLPYNSCTPLPNFTTIQLGKLQFTTYLKEGYPF